MEMKKSRHALSSWGGLGCQVRKGTGFVSLTDLPSDGEEEDCGFAFRAARGSIVNAVPGLFNQWLSLRASAAVGDFSRVKENSPDVE